MEWVPHLMVIGGSSGAVYSYMMMKVHQLKQDVNLLAKWEPSAAVRDDWSREYPETVSHSLLIIEGIRAYAMLKYQHPHAALSKEKAGLLMRYMRRAHQDPRLSHCFHKTFNDKLPLKKALLRHLSKTPFIKMNGRWVPLLLHFNEALMMEELPEISYRN